MASMVLSRPQTQIKTRTKRDGKEREQHQHAVSMNDSQDTTNTLSGTFNLAQAMQSSGRGQVSLRQSVPPPLALAATRKARRVAKKAEHLCLSLPGSQCFAG
mmetsp:Transcript_18305/g.33866  ORF Transcript_18305/g.33866 Transcript_18305/m.33866 type:complete len:102 (-) Transcript_18305:76-381(-)